MFLTCVLLSTFLGSWNACVDHILLVKCVLYLQVCGVCHCVVPCLDDMYGVAFWEGEQLFCHVHRSFLPLFEMLIERDPETGITQVCFLCFDQCCSHSFLCVW